LGWVKRGNNQVIIIIFWGERGKRGGFPLIAWEELRRSRWTMIKKRRGGRKGSLYRVDCEEQKGKDDERKKTTS